jgi:hypothetical protein
MTKRGRTDNTMAKRNRTKGVLLLLVIVLSFLLSDFSWPLCRLSFFFWSLCCLSFCPISLGHCVVCSSSFGHCVVCPFVLFLLAIVLSVLRFTDSDYTFGIFKLFLRHNKGDVGIVLFCFVFHFIDTGYIELIYTPLLAHTTSFLFLQFSSLILKL